MTGRLFYGYFVIFTDTGSRYCISENYIIREHPSGYFAFSNAFILKEAMQMNLMAEALELGTCFCGFFVFAIEESPELRKVLEIPEDHGVPFSYMVGYPDVTFTRLVSRKPARVRWL